MVGTGGIELAHAVDERVRLDEVRTLAGVLVRALGEAY
jgi:acetylornithine deacetylase/succinyl-diaminopimelate desuccinylase-like protein